MSSSYNYQYRLATVFSNHKLTLALAVAAASTQAIASHPSEVQQLGNRRGAPPRSYGPKKHKRW